MPYTLLSLTLTCRSLSDDILPLLHSQLVLKNENSDTCRAMNIAPPLPLDRGLRELHILAEPTLPIPSQSPPSDVITRVADTTAGVSSTLDIRYEYRQHLRNFIRTEKYGQFRKSLWTRLKEKCSQLPMSRSRLQTIFAPSRIWGTYKTTERRPYARRTAYWI